MTSILPRIRRSPLFCGGRSVSCDVVVTVSGGESIVMIPNAKESGAGHRTGRRRQVLNLDGHYPDDICLHVYRDTYHRPVQKLSARIPQESG